MPHYAKELYTKLNEGHLKVSDVHQIFFQVYGNPQGVPVVNIHGGPGAGMDSYAYQWFDPEFFLIVCYDQRGAGKSVPNAAENLELSLFENTTQYLVHDLEKLRKHLLISRWHVFGHSWGSTLGLVYAETFPENVISLLVGGVFLGEASEYDFLFGAIGALNNPDYYHRFSEYIRRHPSLTLAEREGPLLEAYYKLMIDTSDMDTQREACTEFVRHELVKSKTISDPARVDGFLADPSTVVPWALFEAHFMIHHCFLARRQILREAHRIAHLPIQIVHGRCDFVCLPQSAWSLYQAVNGPARKDDASLVIVDGAGHSDTELATIEVYMEAALKLKKFIP